MWVRRGQLLQPFANKGKQLAQVAIKPSLPPDSHQPREQEHWQRAAASPVVSASPLQAYANTRLPSTSPHFEFLCFGCLSPSSLACLECGLLSANKEKSTALQQWQEPSFRTLLWSQFLSGKAAITGGFK